MKRLIIGLILVMLLVPVSCAAPPTPTPAPTPAPAPAPAPSPTSVAVSTLAQACDAVDNYLYTLATTPEAKRLLAVYKDNMWSPNSCVAVVDHNLNRKPVSSEGDYEDWDVKEYIIQHIFDSEFDPGSGALEQILKAGPLMYLSLDETTYPVTWVVDRQTGAVTPNDGNALRIEAELME